jgi:CRP-like cAMP-binding protein
MMVIAADFMTPFSDVKKAPSTDSIERKYSDAKDKRPDETKLRRRSGTFEPERKGSDARDRKGSDASDIEVIIDANKILFVNDTFGETSFFGLPSQLSVIAADDDVQICCMHKNTLNSLLQTDPLICERFFQSICQLLSYRLYNLPIRSAIKKITGFVCTSFTKDTILTF